MAGDREAQTGPAAPDAHAIDLVEALEDPAELGRRDADAMILDAEDDLPVDRRDRHPDLRRLRRGRTVGCPAVVAVGGLVGILRAAELQRVVDEVDDDLAEPGLVAADG